MKTNFRQQLSSLTLAMTLLLSLSISAYATETSPPLTRAQSAAQAAEYAMQYGQADSMQYALWQDGQITLSGHAGNYSRTENRALLDTDLYGIGSTSKVYTAVAVMKLVQEGKVSLDAPVTSYLPDFKMADRRYKQITVRMLLNHSSGLMGSSTANGFLFADPDRSAAEALLERLSIQELKADPGAYSVYCNDGFTLAELVVEAVTKTDFLAYIRTALLSPNGLDDTYAPQDTFDTTRLAKVYLGEDNRPLAQDTLGIVGTGGLYASAADLAAFGGLLTGDKLLSEASRKAMAAPEYDKGLWPDDGEDFLSYGLGWDSVEWFPFSQSGIQALVKGGDTLQYHAGLIILPEHNMAAAVVSSGGVSTFNELAATRLLIDALAEKGVTVDETVPKLPAAAPAAMPKALLDLAGYYNSTMLQQRVDLTADGELSIHSLNMADAPVQTFTYHSDGSFRDAAGMVLLKLVTEENGKTYLYQQAYNALPGLSTLPNSNYAAVRVEAKPVSAAVQKAWDDAVANCVLLLNEKYSSQMWMQALTAGSGDPAEGIPGYVGSARIIDESLARYEIQVPGSGGRDGNHFVRETQGGQTYLKAGGTVFGDKARLRTLSGRSGDNATIQADGYARWYTIGEAAAGTTMTVRQPKASGFTVYDTKGVPVASSAAWGDSSAVLPAGGYVVFVGAPGARFDLNFAKNAS